MASAPDYRGPQHPQRIYAAAPSSSLPVVKSAARVLHILEFFDDVRRPATAAEIASFFNFPQSSTSQLLRSMMGSGYLEFDRDSRCYSPSPRVSLLGSWCHDRLICAGSLLRMMQRMNRRTERAVFLASQVGCQAKYIHIYQSLIAGRPHLTLGTDRPLSASGAGIALMSMLTDAEASRFVLRNNDERDKDMPATSIRGVLAMLAEVRRTGYLCFMDSTISAGVLAAPLPHRSSRAPIAICLGDHMDFFARERAALEAIFLEELERYKQETSAGLSNVVDFVNLPH